MPNVPGLAARLLPSLLLVLMPHVAAAQSPLVASFAVHAGRYERVDVPVTARLEGVSVPSGAVQLFEVTDGRDVPVAAQLLPGDGPRLAWVLAGRTTPGQVRFFEWRRVDTPATAAGPTVRVEDDGESLHASVGGRPVLGYRYAVQAPPDGVDPRYGRGGFLHPLYSPQGQVLTRIQPPDHYHHYGIWNPWTHTDFEGREVDFWNLAKGQGTVRSRGAVERTAGPVAGGFRAIHDHVDLSAPEGEKVALHETWDVRVWNVDPAQRVWLVDFVSRLNAATPSPLTIEAYRYQGFSLRATELWNDETAALLTSAGYDRGNANGTRARWVDVHGVAETPAGTAGVLFMSHPANHDFPEQLRIWPTGMNEGEANVYVNFNPAQERDWTLAPGHTHTLAYRMLVYDGAIDRDTAERYWRDFAYPPAVEVFPATPLAGARVLVYTRNGKGYVHDNLAASVAALRELGDAHGFAVDATDDPAVFHPDSLRRYDALVFANTNNDVFTDPAQREALQAYVRGGGGVVGIHSASGTERHWPWFAGLMGGRFVRHAPRQDFTARVVDRSHPSTGFLPGTWPILDDECYYVQEINPGIRVLLAADLASVSDGARGDYPGRVFGDRFPIAWYQTFDGGRQWYTSLGHRSAHYDDPLFRRHLLGGLQWVVAGAAP